jgi:hypothetical protein
VPIKVLDVGKGFVDYALFSAPLTPPNADDLVVRRIAAGTFLLRDRLCGWQSVAGHRNA